jgi:hypothetical protein
MPYCTLEEAWGENIYNTSAESSTNTSKFLYTDKIEQSTETDYLRPKDHSAFIVDNEQANKEESYNTIIKEEISRNNNNQNNYIPNSDTNNNSKNILDLESYIEKLKKENEELKNIISKKTIEQDMEKNSIKFKLIDILIYILTGIFIIFIIDLIFKHTLPKSKVRNRIF